jgi:hypothetical protein
MLLIQAVILALIFCLIRPYNKGLFNTRKWIAKIREPKGTLDNEETNITLLQKDVKIMSIDLVLKPTMNTVFLLAGIIMGFLYKWWGGLLVIAITRLLKEVTILYLTPSLAYYLKRNRRIVMKKIEGFKEDDEDELEEYKKYLADLEKILVIYKDSKLKPPDSRELRDIPYGDINYFINNYELAK